MGAFLEVRDRFSPVSCHACRAHCRILWPASSQACIGGVLRGPGPLYLPIFRVLHARAWCLAVCRLPSRKRRARAALATACRSQCHPCKAGDPQWRTHTPQLPTSRSCRAVRSLRCLTVTLGPSCPSLGACWTSAGPAIACIALCFMFVPRLCSSSLVLKRVVELMVLEPAKVVIAFD